MGYGRRNNLGRMGLQSIIEHVGIPDDLVAHNNLNGRMSILLSTVSDVDRSV